ncbi:hypothetical protein F5B19DRAFT_492092 [Rostrohypoxylon terebratum]|nr:hypothetical protein F5B19DRAFT_492092 [Rostrohypoxylon terebratum]
MDVLRPSRIAQREPPTLRCDIHTIRDSKDSSHEHSDDKPNSHSSDILCDPLCDADKNEKNFTELWYTKAFALCKYLWPSTNDDTLSIRFLGSGSWNVAFTISVMIAENEAAEYVLRIPTFDDTIAHSVGILEYLTKFTNLKVPRVIRWDITNNNPLKNGYIILSRIPGRSLHSVLDDLDHEQKLLLAKELALLYHQIESVTSPFAGTIQVHDQDIKYRDELHSQTFVQPFGTVATKRPINSVNSDNAKDRTLSLRFDPPGSSVGRIMVSMFLRRIYAITNDENRNMDYSLKYFRLCKSIVEDMGGRGLFDSQKSFVCLCHPDLFPRNIMVDFSPNITITGILDWDDAQFVPRFAGRVFPKWLWQSDETESKHTPDPNESMDESLFRYLYGPELLDPKKSEPDSPQNAEIKLAFDKAMGESWVSEAASEWFVLARAILPFSERKLFSNYTPRQCAIWKDKWKSLATDPIENLYLWTQKWNMPIFSLSYHETVPYDQKENSKPMSGEGESTTSRAPLRRSRSGRLRLRFREQLNWILSIPKIPSEKEECPPSPPCLPAKLDDNPYSGNYLKTHALPQSLTPLKPHFIEPPEDHYAMLSAGLKKSVESQSENGNEQEGNPDYGIPKPSLDDQTN